MTKNGKLVAVLSKDSGRAILNTLWDKKVNVSDVFVPHEKYKINGSGFRSFDDLFENPRGDTKIHKVKQLRDHVEILKEIKPDFILMNFSEVLEDEVLEIPKYGAAGFHYAKLPDRRGCNPDMWAIIHGLKKSAVTLHHYEKSIDTGDIIGEKGFEIDPQDDSASVLRKIRRGVVELVDEHIENLLAGTAPRIKQEGPGIYTPRRSFEDGRIYLAKTRANEAHDKIRALRPPYGGAYVLCGPKGQKERLYLMSSEFQENSPQVDSSQIINWKNSAREIHSQISENPMYAITGNGLIKITETRIGGMTE